VYAVASGKGGVGRKSVGTVEPGRCSAAQGRKVGVVEADNLRVFGAAMLGATGHARPRSSR